MEKLIWKGRDGYGDIVSPLCQAYNLSKVHETKIKLEFHWDYDKDWKRKEEDPQCAWQIVDHIRTMGEKIYPRFAEVEVEHFFNSNPDKCDNYLYSPMQKGIQYHNVILDMMHGVKPPKVHSPIRNVTVVNSNDNDVQFMEEEDQRRTWKDPLAGQWEEYADILRDRGFNVTEVSYTTPIEDLFENMMNAEMVVGYHGSATWLARFLQRPLLIHSRDKKWTEWAFPWAVHKEFIKINTDYLQYAEISKTDLNNCILDYRKYIQNEKAKNFRRV